MSEPLSMDQKLQKLSAALQNEHRLEGELILLKSQLAKALTALHPFAIENYPITPLHYIRAAKIYKELIAELCHQN